jgi:hypothetical protein
MPLATIIQLLAQFGLPLTQQIYVWVKEGKNEVTPEDFAALVKLSQYRSADSLAAAGIKIENGVVVPA